jgi:hypothetical protein
MMGSLPPHPQSHPQLSVGVMVEFIVVAVEEVVGHEVAQGFVMVGAREEVKEEVGGLGEVGGGDGEGEEPSMLQNKMGLVPPRGLLSRVRMMTAYLDRQKQAKNLQPWITLAQEKTCTRTLVIWIPTNLPQALFLTFNSCSRTMTYPYYPTLLQNLFGRHFVAQLLNVARTSLRAMKLMFFSAFCAKQNGTSHVFERPSRTISAMRRNGTQHSIGGAAMRAFCQKILLGMHSCEFGDLTSLR